MIRQENANNTMPLLSQHGYDQSKADQSVISVYADSEYSHKKSYKRFHVFDKLKSAKKFQQHTNKKIVKNQIQNNKCSMKTVSIDTSNQGLNLFLKNITPKSKDNINVGSKQEVSFVSFNDNQNGSKSQIRLRKLSFNFKRNDIPKKDNGRFLSFNPQIVNYKFSGALHKNSKQFERNKQPYMKLQIIKNLSVYLKQIKQTQKSIIQQLQLQKNKIEEQFKQISKKMKDINLQKQKKYDETLEIQDIEMNNKITQIIDQLNQGSEDLIKKLRGQVRNEKIDQIGKIVKNLIPTNSKFLKRRTTTQKTREDQFPENILYLNTLIETKKQKQNQCQNLLIQPPNMLQTNQHSQQGDSYQNININFININN